MFLLLLVTASFLFASGVKAENTVDLYFFYDDSCTHCIEEGEYLDTLALSFDNIVIHRYEVFHDDENAALFQEVKTAFHKRTALTPFLVIGGVALVGFSDQTKTDIEALIQRDSGTDHVDVVGKILVGEEVLDSDIEFLRFASGDYVNLPLIGEVPIDSLSLFLAAVVIGFVDGFNPCAMWVLLFLIAMLVNLKSNLRRWTIGLAFLLTSAVVYFLIMAAWLNIGLTIASVVWIRVLIALFAIGFGAFNIHQFIKATKAKAEGCEIVDQNKRRKIGAKIRAIISERNLFLAIAGVMVLAASVNLLELACSAGLPLLYTQILAYNQLAPVVYYLYILVYIFFFLIDDLIIFAIAMVTLQTTGISKRYTKFSYLAGGLIMVAIGILLMFFPQIIMFA